MAQKLIYLSPDNRSSSKTLTQDWDADASRPDMPTGMGDMMEQP